MTITSFEQLEIWQEAKRLYEKILMLTSRELVAKDYRFKSNIREAAGSVMDNIAEGFERDSRLEFVNHLSYAKGSTGEIRSHLIRGNLNGYWTKEETTQLSNEYMILSKRIASLIKYLNTTVHKGLKFRDRE